MRISRKIFAEELIGSAITQDMAKYYPKSPMIVDITKAPDQLGLRPAQIRALEDAMMQGSGKIILPEQVLGK
jgi:hypothetical protein